MGRWIDALRRALLQAVPVMLAYVSIGLPCGVMESKAGISPAFVFLLSLTYYSGAGQFMIPNMWIIGAPWSVIAMAVSFANTRQILYSTSFAPRFSTVPRLRTLVFSATLTDESFGVNAGRFAKDPLWDSRCACALNLCCMLSWASANVVGCAVGPVVDLPVTLLSFAMTSIFICLAVTQDINEVTLTVMCASALCVLALKLCGFPEAAMLGGAVAGVVAGIVLICLQEGRAVSR